MEDKCSDGDLIQGRTILSQHHVFSVEWTGTPAGSLSRQYTWGYYHTFWR